MINFLRKMPFFDGLSDRDLQKITSAVSQKEYAAGITIFSEDEEAIGFYFVISGRVKIYKLSPEGKEHVLHICEPESMFAEAAMFSGKAYPAYATAISQTRLLFIRKKNFVALIKENPEMSLKMLGALSNKLREFNMKIEDLSIKEISARLAKYLLDICSTNRTMTFDLKIKKLELAQKLGTVSETLSRTLKKFRDKNIIASDKNKISILNIELLQDVAAGLKI